MYIKSLISVLVITSSFVFTFGQTPETGKEKGRAVRALAFTFEDGGGYLGVQTQDVTKENFAKFGLSSVRGVAVEKVVENSPAAAAGIQAGDVIVRFDGEEVASVRKLMRLISEVAADHQVKITLLRNNSEQEVTATLGKRPMPKFENGSFSVMRPMGELPDFERMPAPPMPQLPRTMNTPGFEGRTFSTIIGNRRQIGIGVTALTKQLASHYGVESGLLISDVRDGSPAYKAGLKAGDIIVEADGKAVKGDFDLIKTIQEKKEGDVQITFVRAGNRQTVNVTPETSKTDGFVFETNEEIGPNPPPTPQLFKMVQPLAPPSPMARPNRIL